MIGDRKRPTLVESVAFCAPSRVFNIFCHHFGMDRNYQGHQEKPWTKTDLLALVVGRQLRRILFENELAKTVSFSPRAANSLRTEIITKSFPEDSLKCQWIDPCCTPRRHLFAGYVRCKQC